MMGVSTTSTPPGEVSKHTVHVCLGAIGAVALACFAGTFLHVLQELLSLHKGPGVFHFNTIAILFWIAAGNLLVILGAALLAYLIFKGHRDAAVASAGYCLALVALNAVPFFRSILNFADSAATIVVALQNLLLLATPAAALVVLLFLLHRWPAQAKMPA